MKQRYNNKIMPQIKPYILTPIALLILMLMGCDPLASQPTPAVFVITAVPSPTPRPTVTPQETVTPVPSLTPIVTVTSTPPACDEEAGQVIHIDKFQSAIANENLRYRVYIPPCYQKTQRRYPYLIMLHGAAQKEDEWEKLGGIGVEDQGFRLGVLPPMIIIMPYVGTIGNNSYFPPDPSYETVVLEELVPAIERDFCTWSDRDHRAIGGISRGGFWAFSIGMRHPDVFGIIGGHSPYMTEDTFEIPAAFNPLELALNSALLPEAKLRMYIDNGAEDPSGRTIELLSSRLTEQGIPHTYVINPIGNHDDEYWSAHVSEYLTFYGHNWPRSAGDLPSCLEPSP
ncbi:MAG: alpha/beta hydrolase-fold protein [Anaerolineae bacterium]